MPSMGVTSLIGIMPAADWASTGEREPKPGHTAPAGDPVLADVAAEAMRLVHIDPRVARGQALRLRAAARRVGDAGAESAAERVLGLAARESNRMRSAALHLRRAVAVADQAGLPVPAARARMTLALVRADQGDIPGAVRLGEAASAHLEGLEAARLRHQLAVVAQRRGLLEEALHEYGGALAVFRREGDLLWQAKVLNNRGVLQAYRGRPGPAEADLLRAEELYAKLGQDLAVADVRWNRGFAAGRAGQVVAALTHLAAAEEHYVRNNLSAALIMMDRCDVLLSAGLHEEAREVAAAAVRELARRRMAADLAEARLLLAAAALACGATAEARKAARLAGRAFDQQGRPGWAAVARYMLIRTDWAAGRHGPDLLRAAVAGAEELRAGGWAVAASDAALIAARCALAAGRTAEATELLRHTGRARGAVSPAAQRVSAWHAEALLRIAGGDRRGADAALRAGLRALDEHRLTLGATELRVRAAEHGLELVRTALDVAVADGSARALLTWAERGRAAAQQARPAHPPADDGFAAEIAELRAVAAEREQALAEGRDARRHSQRQAHLERSIRERTRRARPGTSDATALAGSRLAERRVGPRAAGWDVGALTSCLGDRALVELITVGDTMYAVVLAGGRLTRHELGPVTAVDAEVRGLRFALHRMSLRSGGGEAGGERLDTILFGPLRSRIGGADLVIVPSGRLHGVPWRLLPACRDRTVSVAPSAAAWLRAVAAEPSGDGTVLVAGPGLPGAADEITSLAGRYGATSALLGADARVAAVLHAMDGAGRTHIAAHGTFRADNPQFSALRLGDGPLTVYDLEGLRRPPGLVVLSACDSGMSTVHRGDEIMGFAAALLAMGTRSVVATVAPVRDGAARDVMLRLHEHLRSGRSPAAALAEAQRESGDDPAAAAYVCYGAG
ncbi:CHAT domain-containing protein [Actinoplanes xinjiangensis]|uniref:Tetratricopeptide repeat protein n=1 Tax=Actinoplanes xinjiangensis TaxID=512350 RepID=A0A316F5X3_9ACTN|nr:CHAT domain-containing protein [Actinoplanes xinjiangensis]PWK40107.1 tetratricopeptide repeat protein [Actinoplanes xinjiangensis]